ncbi:MAG: CO dehydrogenase/acetyl-CoA synthase subunit delta [Euryarchaeota archaeon]|nr:CO dehydrogenase/acetyl-CoA synthase subunit delta [Euryarchaeota archaeon]
MKKDLAELLKLLKDVDSLELEKVRIEAEELELDLSSPAVQTILTELPKVVPKLVEQKFQFPVESYLGQVAEVQLGAARAEGGTRGKIVKVGGDKAPPFYRFDSTIVNRPVIAFDVFDTPQPQFPKVLKEEWKDVWEDPAAWAKKAVERYEADLITIHLISADPLIKDTAPKEAAKTVEKVLQAVDVPIVIGGCGAPEKDPFVLEAAAEVAQGERCLLASATLDSDYKRVAQAALKYNHVVLSFTSMDINNQKELNRYLLKEGLPPTSIIMDPTTGALGYGLDYTLSLMERIKLSALRGEKELQMPISSGTTNAYGARESWKKRDEWGPREYRGPLWEIVTGLTATLAGANMLMMLHPTAVRILKEIIDSLTTTEGYGPLIENWIAQIR